MIPRDQPTVTMGYIIQPSIRYPDFKTAISKGAEQLLKSNTFPRIQDQLNSAKENPRYNNLEINCIIMEHLQKPFFHFIHWLDLGHIVFYDKKNNMAFLKAYELEDSIWFPKINLVQSLDYIETCLYNSNNPPFLGCHEKGYLLFPGVPATTFYDMYGSFIK